jgi:Outer membrane receptor for ferrienterochelin and colicins
MNKLLLTTILLFFCLLIQAKDFNLKGKIIDGESNLPVSLAEIILTDSNNNTLFYGIVSDENAQFSFEKITINISPVLLEIRSMGYESFIISAKPEEMEFEIDLGEIQLMRKDYLLDEIVVTASSSIEVVDKTIYRIDSSWLKDVSVSLDLLRKVPEITINDLYRTVDIKGKNNTLVLINGINTGQSIDLRTINYQDIEKIEVVQIPPSETDISYDGIVNIILKKKINSGFTIDIEETLKLDLNSNDSYIGFTYGKDKIRTRLSYNNYLRRNSTDLEEVRTNNLSEESYITSGRLKPIERNHDINFSLDYQLSEKKFFNLSTRTSFSNNDKKINRTVSTSQNGLHTNQPSFFTKYKAKYVTGNYAAFYRHNSDREGTSFSINTNFNFQKSDDNENSFYEDGTVFINHEKGDKYAFNLKTNYIYRFNAQFSLSAGLQGYYQRFHGKVNNQTNDNNFDNYRYNIFGDLYYTRKETQITLGLKVEENINDYQSNYKTVRQTIIRPQLALLRKINMEHSFRLQYYRNSYLPSAWSLAPYEVQSDEKTIFKGNPNLKSQVYDYIGLSHLFRKKDLSLTSTVYYWRGDDLITTVSEYDANLYVTRMPVNIGQYDRYAANVSGSILLLGFIQIDPSVLVFYEKYNVLQKQDNWSVSLSGTVFIGLPAGFSIGTLGSYTGKWLTPLGHRKASYNLDYVFLMKRFDNIGLNVFVGYHDLLRSSNKEYSFVDHFSQNNYSKIDAQGFMVRISYYFNSGKKVKMTEIPTSFESDKK